MQLPLNQPLRNSDKTVNGNEYRRLQNECHCGKAGSADGFFVHAGLALAEGGRALGVYWLRPWARLEALKSIPQRIRGKESKRWMEGLEQAVELGRACPCTRVITVCDQEGDIFPLLRRQAGRPQAAGLLVRASGTCCCAARAASRCASTWPAGSRW